MNDGRDAIVLALKALIVIVAVVYFVLRYAIFPPMVTSPPQTQIARYVTPRSISVYVEAMDEYTAQGGTNPALSWEFYVQEIAVPQGSTTEAYAAEVAANQVALGGGPSRAQVTHFSVNDGTAYIVLNIDEEGWAGVSFVRNRVHSLVEKTLLLYPSITRVELGKLPQLQDGAAVN